MNKILINSDEELFDIFFDLDLELDLIEQELGIEFAFEDGSSPSDKNVNENQNVSRDLYRVLNEDLMPQSYPCILVILHEKSADRIGKFEALIFEFVYEGDFKK